MKIDSITLDSSFLISLFMKEADSKMSKKLMNYALKEKIIFLIPIIVLLEVFHTLARLEIFKNSYEHDKFQNFLNSDSFKYFDLNMRFFNLFRELPFFNKLKTSDAIIAASAFLNKTLLITWDKKIVSNVASAFTPKEFLEKFVD